MNDFFSLRSHRPVTTVSTRQVPSGLVIRSPVSGHIINKAIVQGDKVDAGMTLFDVADLSHAWVEADVFETDIPLLHAGQKVRVYYTGPTESRTVERVVVED